MDNRFINVATTVNSKWFSEEFIYTNVVKYLKENGYKIYDEPVVRENGKCERVINASKFFKREIIEVKGLPENAVTQSQLPVKTVQHAKSWFSDALLHSFTNFATFDNAEIAMALPNAGRYVAIIEKLHDYFTVNDLYFRIYLVNEDGSIEVSNLNEKFKN